MLLTCNWNLWSLFIFQFSLFNYNCPSADTLFNFRFSLFNFFGAPSANHLFTFQFSIFIVPRRTPFSIFNFVLSFHLLCGFFIIYLVTSYFGTPFHEARKRWNCHAKRPVIEIYQQSLCARMCV